MKKYFNKNKELTNFYVFLLGQFVSQFGSKLTGYGLVLWAYSETGSVLTTSLLAVCYQIPEIFLNFIAGSISDKWNKKKIMLVADGVAALGSFCILMLIINNSLRIGYVYGINVLLGIMDAFQSPASEVTESIIVSKENYMRTSGMRSFCNSFIGIFAPIAATAFYSFFGLKILVCIDLITFAFAVITLVKVVKIPDTYEENVEDEALWIKCKFGIKYLFKQKDILSLIAFMAFVNFIAAMYSATLSPMVLSRGGNNKFQLGIVTSTIGVAGLIGSVLVTNMKPRGKKISLCLNIMSFSFLICNSLLGIGRSYYVWTLAVFIGNVLIPFLVANVDYIMRTKVPINMQGRVFSARNTLQYACIPIGYVFGGALNDYVFEPFMSKVTPLQSFFSKIVGSGQGSGMALFYIVLGIGGFLGCCLFRKNENMKSLDL